MSVIRVRHRGPLPHLGTVVDRHSLSAPCALGRSGVVTQKREGDGGTPRGVFTFRAVLYRADRVSAPRTFLPVHPIRVEHGWCDSANDPAYNQCVHLPFEQSHEVLARKDHLYNLVVVLGHNDAPTVAGLGSAIFLHLASSDFGPTEGCVAVREPILRRMLARAGQTTALEIL